MATIQQDFSGLLFSVCKNDKMTDEQWARTLKKDGIKGRKKVARENMNMFNSDIKIGDTVKRINKRGQEFFFTVISYNNNFGTFTCKNEYQTSELYAREIQKV